MANEIKKIVTLDNIAEFKTRADNKYLSKTFKFHYHYDESGEAVGLVYPDSIAAGAAPIHDLTADEYDYVVIDSDGVTEITSGRAKLGTTLELETKVGKTVSGQVGKTAYLACKNSTGTYNEEIASGTLKGEVGATMSMVGFTAGVSFSITIRQDNNNYKIISGVR